MSEVQDRPSAATPPPSAAPVVSLDHSTDPLLDADPFLKLHKMSTTAGLGSADYVAINGSAIAALLLGIASAFVLMGSNLFLLLPLAGVICAVLAFVKVGTSNGTQTGRGLAALGLLLSLGFAGFYLSRTIYEARRNQADTDAVVALIQNLGHQVSQQKYDEAYNAVVDDHMKQRVTPQQFAAAWQRFNTSKTLGGITVFDWNHLVEFGDDPVTGDRVASGTIMVEFKNVAARDREPAAFRKVGGTWMLEDLSGLFTVPDTATPGAKPARRSEVAGPPAPGAGQ